MSTGQGHTTELHAHGDKGSDHQWREDREAVRAVFREVREGGGEVKPSKYVTVTVTQGDYGQGWEDEACALDRKEAKATLRDYRWNSPYPSRNIRRRVLREDYDKSTFRGK